MLDIVEVKKNNVKVYPQSHIAAIEGLGLATNGNNGLVTSGEREDILNKCNKASIINNYDGSKTDILNLGFGLYVARNLINKPDSVDDSVCLVEIKGNSIYKQITFYWLTAYKKYERSIYDTSDSKWFDESWLSLPLLNSHTGYVYVRRERLNTLSLIEINFSVTHPDGLGARIFATLPVDYSQTINRDIVMNAYGEEKNSTVTRPLLCLIKENNLIGYRDSASTSYKYLYGNGTFLR